MVYPTLLAAVGDVAHPAWRARSVGIYRLWRDGGFAVGALLAGIVADALGVRATVSSVAALTAVSGLVVAVRMYETRQRSSSAVHEESMMGDLATKNALFAEFAAVGKVLGNPTDSSSLTYSSRGLAASTTLRRPRRSG